MYSEVGMYKHKIIILVTYVNRRETFMVAINQAEISNCKRNPVHFWTRLQGNPAVSTTACIPLFTTSNLTCDPFFCLFSYHRFIFYFNPLLSNKASISWIVSSLVTCKIYSLVLCHTRLCLSNINSGNHSSQFYHVQRLHFHTNLFFK